MQYNIDIWIDNERLHCRLIWLHFKWYTAVNKYNPIPPCIIVTLLPTLLPESTNIYHNSTLKFRILSLIDTVWGMFIWSVYVRQALELHAACIVEKIAQQSPKAHSVDHPVSVTCLLCSVVFIVFVLYMSSGQDEVITMKFNKWNNNDNNQKQNLAPECIATRQCLYVQWKQWVFIFGLCVCVYVYMNGFLVRCC